MTEPAPRLPTVFDHGRHHDHGGTAGDNGPGPGGACCQGPQPLRPDGPRGSRRRRLWDLGEHAHCPVVGLCLPVPVLRRVLERHVVVVPDDDYTLHCQGVTAARRRSALTEALQRELDTRHAQALRHAARHKSTDDLLGWWRAERHGPQMAGALWAVLTHARCDTGLEDRVLAHVHMQQHEVGQMARALADRQQQLLADQARLARDHAAMAARLDDAARMLARERERHQAELMRVRGTLLARETLVAQLHGELQALQQAAPDLPARQALARQLAEQGERARDLQRSLDRMLAENARLRADAAAAPRAAVAAAPEPAAAPAAEALRDRAVLCVGGRTGAVPVYRQLVEATGAQFLHHDGGTEENPQRLEQTLAAADLVICQTGCISHDAYWRVKDHCRRTGKRCVFVDQPSASSLQRALGTMR